MKPMEAFTIVTHVASQLIGRWLAPPCELPPGSGQSDLNLRNFSIINFFDLTQDDWEDLMWEDKQNLVPTLRWIAQLTGKRPDFISGVAAATFTHLQNVKISHGCVLLFCDPHYPQHLRMIAKPPLMLSYIGCIDALARPKISVIGSRQANYFGLSQSMKLGEFLAETSICVVSGGAIGCDIAVHLGMLASNVTEIGACVVFAGGLGKLYPRRHADIFGRILDRGGVLISERLWWQCSLPRDFPIRNRIVSGLSQYIVVMQAGETSGAMITADEALEQGREVFVLEHDPSDIRALGSRKLLDDGAIGFNDAKDIAGIFKLALDEANFKGDSIAENIGHNGRRLNVNPPIPPIWSG
ncbi:MAG: DNA-protecting protein DprA [Proteobacteria bacterium]|nr:DNA-protecting protein DprA [Pseudomonadota bacterium]